MIVSMICCSVKNSLPPSSYTLLSVFSFSSDHKMHVARSSTHTGCTTVPLAGLPGVPDFVALVLAFWCLREPLKIGMGIAFLLGLGMDIADASIIGQHTMAYVLLAYAANSLSRRILWFPLLQQALQIFPLLLLAQAVMLAIRLVTGASFPGLSYFLGCIIATLLWYPLTYLLMLEGDFVAGSVNIETLDPAAEGMNVVLKTIENAGLKTVMSNSFGFGGTNATLVMRKL